VTKQPPRSRKPATTARKSAAPSGKKLSDKKSKDRAGEARKRGKGTGKPGGIPVRGSRAAAGSGVRTRSAPAQAASAAAAAACAQGQGQGQGQGKDRRVLDATRGLALDAMGAALDKKALMPVLIDVSAMASYTDFIGIVSGRSDRQVDAIADGIIQLMKARGRYVLGHEGSGSGRWTLLDFGEIVIHVFYHPVREFYDLESLWIDAPRVKMDIPPEAMLSQPDALYESL
jgi:ribosome-associated protein